MCKGVAGQECTAPAVKYGFCGGGCRDAARKRRNPRHHADLECVLREQEEKERLAREASEAKQRTAQREASEAEQRAAQEMSELKQQLAELDQQVREGTELAKQQELDQRVKQQQAKQQAAVQAAARAELEKKLELAQVQTERDRVLREQAEKERLAREESEAKQRSTEQAEVAQELAEVAQELAEAREDAERAKKLQLAQLAKQKQVETQAEQQAAVLSATRAELEKKLEQAETEKAAREQQTTELKQQVAEQRAKQQQAEQQAEQQADQMQAELARVLQQQELQQVEHAKESAKSAFYQSITDTYRKEQLLFFVTDVQVVDQEPLQDLQHKHDLFMQKLANDPSVDDKQREIRQVFHTCPDNVIPFILEKGMRTSPCPTCRNTQPAGPPQPSCKDTGWFGIHTKGFYVSKHADYTMWYQRHKPVKDKDTGKVILLQAVTGKVKWFADKDMGAAPDPNYHCHTSCNDLEFYLYDEGTTADGAPQHSYRAIPKFVISWKAVRNDRPDIKHDGE
jgi:hypothetical protein